jgi:hypothetical protein
MSMMAFTPILLGIGLNDHSEGPAMPKDYVAALTINFRTKEPRAICPNLKIKNVLAV